MEGYPKQGENAELTLLITHHKPKLALKNDTLAFPRGEAKTAFIPLLYLYTPKADHFLASNPH
jgi:hypothetical protein